MFLAIELQQNNELMEADARFNRLMISRDAWDQTATDGDLTELRVRARRGEPLTEVERERVRCRNAHARKFRMDVSRACR